MSLTRTAEKPVKTIEITKDLSIGLFRNGMIMTMIHGVPFVQCRKAILVMKREDDLSDRMSEYRNMDELLAGRDAHERNLDGMDVDKETEMFVHASTIQGWVESGYNIDIIDTRIAFPILLELSKTNLEAKQALFYEVQRRWEEGNVTSRAALYQQKAAKDVIDFIRLSSKTSLNPSERRVMASSPFLTVSIAKKLIENTTRHEFFFKIAQNRNIDEEFLTKILSRKPHVLTAIAIMTGSWYNENIDDAGKIEILNMTKSHVFESWDHDKFDSKHNQQICDFYAESTLLFQTELRKNFNNFIEMLIQDQVFKKKDVVYINEYLRSLDSVRTIRRIDTFFKESLKPVSKGSKSITTDMLEDIIVGEFKDLGPAKQEIIVEESSDSVLLKLVLKDLVKIEDLQKNRFKRFLLNMYKFDARKKEKLLAGHGVEIWNYAETLDGTTSELDGKEIFHTMFGREWEGGFLNDVYAWQCESCGKPQKSTVYPTSFFCDECAGHFDEYDE